jgi:hypothetical protein
VNIGTKLTCRGELAVTTPQRYVLHKYLVQALLAEVKTLLPSLDDEIRRADCFTIAGAAACSRAAELYMRMSST